MTERISNFGKTFKVGTLEIGYQIDTDIEPADVCGDEIIPFVYGRGEVFINAPEGRCFSMDVDTYWGKYESGYTWFEDHTDNGEGLCEYVESGDYVSVSSEAYQWLENQAGGYSKLSEALSMATCMMLRDNKARAQEILEEYRKEAA